MRYAGLLVALALTLSPAQAQDGDVDPKADVEQGFSLLEEGTRLLLRGLIDQVEPELRDMMAEVEPQLRAMMDEFGPAMRELGAKIGDLSAYHAPVVLPNGDILIRRKVPLVPQNGEIDL